MRHVAITTLCLLPALMRAQTPRPVHVVPMRPQFEYLRPFRVPDKNLQPPLELYDHLRTMQAIVRAPGSYKIEIDREGREVCTSPAWRDARDKAEVAAARMGGYLAVVCQESGSAADRGLGFYGAYWVDSIQDTIAIMSLIPGEPVASIRADAMQRALAFLRVQLAKNRGGSSDPRAPSPTEYAGNEATGSRVFNNPDAPLYDFDVNPWCALLECKEARDQAQGLWFLSELVKIRKDQGPPTLALVQTLLPATLTHSEAEVRKQARAYLAAVDPETRPVPADDAPAEQVRAWLEAIVYDVFPPIRRISSGLVELYPSADLDRVAATGKDLLSRDAIGSTASGTVNGLYYRGFKLQRLPDPLDRLGLPTDAVVTHVNGVPVTDSKGLLQTIELFVARRQTLIVEYVAKEQQKALEFRLK
ncbi:MAG: hypothetical protein R3F56_21625 [Planctomycetota bacterium]